MNLDFLGTLQRTHMCGALRSTNAGETVTIMGWVNRRRDHGNLIFLDVRDRTGITQVVLDKEASPEAHAKAEAARPEYVVAVTGNVRVRGEGLANPKMDTGDIEVVGQVARGDEVLALALTIRPDVALLDIEMPGMTGLELVRELFGLREDAAEEQPQSQESPITGHRLAEVHDLRRRRER